MEQRYVGEVLVRHGALSAERLPELLETAEEKGVDLTDLLLATRAIEEEALVRALATEVGMPVRTKLAPEDVAPELVDLVPITFARQHGILALRQTADTVQVAVSDPLDQEPLDDLRALLRKAIDPVAAPRETIEDVINRVYERKDEAALEQGDDAAVEELQDIIDLTDEAPVIRWVNNIFYTSVRDRASDIHIEPTDKEVIVRYRIDGKLVVKKTAHKGFLASIVSRVKIEAGLNIAEKRLPQDGRISKKIAGKVIDVRVSTIPTAKGERIVMRLLDKENVLLSLTDLGFDQDNFKRMAHLITRPNGIILVTGPTGSGKTTTLYACLNQINEPNKNILTVEDPVEYELKGIGQMQIQPKIGLTFASGLRSFLRQDPDVIMVGEIRDHETAEIAIHASLTGHLVLSTLHTNDAPGAITRLVDMGIQPFQISSSILAVLAQRLVRRLCPHCRAPYKPSPVDLRELGLDPNNAQQLRRLRDSNRPPAPTNTAEILEALELEEAELVEQPTRVRPYPVAPLEPPNGEFYFYRPVGCEQCSGTGYRGRIGIYELMTIDEPVRREILNNSDASTIGKAAQQRGMLTLRDDGARQVLAGATSLEEVLAATQAGDLE